MADAPVYVVVSPCRDEADYMEITLQSMVGQTWRPTQWIIVDDGSSDATPDILRKYQSEYPWIKIVTRDNRGHRAVGPGVVDAFWAGHAEIDLEEYDYIVKLDLDLDIPRTYFETILGRMNDDPRLGTSSGLPYVPVAGSDPIPEGAQWDVSAGMTKIYRRVCFEQIGGIRRGVMWDGIDCHLARMNGWKVIAFDDCDAVRFLHLRAMGSSQKSIWTGRQRHGAGQAFMGTSWWYMGISAAFRMLKPPYVLGGALMYWGYLKARLSGQERFEHPGFRAFLRRYHWAILTRGRLGAVTKTEADFADRFEPTRREDLPS